jgi:hypothetical protein
LTGLDLQPAVSRGVPRVISLWSDVGMTGSPGNNPKHRFFRFRLQSLLLGILVLGLALGWKVDRANRQRDAVAWVVKNGGSLRYEHEKIDACGYPLPGRPPGPKWLLDVLGIDFLEGVAVVHLSGTPVSDLTPLAGLTTLQELDLAGTPVSDLGPLSGLTRLKSLEINNCSRVTDLAPLARLWDLSTLHVDSMPRVTDFAPLARLTKMQELYAYNTPVSDLTPLAGLSNLRHLDLLDTRASDLSPLRHLKNLQTLRFRGGQVSDLSPLAGLTSAQITIWPGGDVNVPEALQAQVLWQ